MIDLASALEALADAGVRVPLDLDSAFVKLGPEGAHGLVDPLRESASGELVLGAVDTASTVRELADLLGEISKAPTKAVDEAIAAVRRGELSRPSELAMALESAAPPINPKRSNRRRPMALAIGGIVVLVAAAGAILAVTREGGHTQKPTPPAPASTASARVLARIPLGLKKAESPTGLAFLGKGIWITTSAGRLIHVDATTNQVVGSPLAVDAGHGLGGVAVAGGSLWVAGWSGSLFRIDPQAARVTRKLKLGGRLSTVHAAGGVLWVARSTSTRNTVEAQGGLIRVDARTMQRMGAPIKVMSYPVLVETQGSRVWVMGTFAPETGVIRIDLATGKRVTVKTGYQGSGMVLQGKTLWVSDRGGGAATPINADSMTFRRSLQIKRVAVNVATSSSDTWVMSGDSEGTGTLRLARFDAHSGRQAGRPLALGSSTGGLLAVRPEAVWAVTDKLLRLAPTTPRPALAAAPNTRQPRRMESGPLLAGKWRAGSFAVPFTFSVPAFRWSGAYPLADSLSFLATHGKRAELDLFAPRTVWVNDTKAEPVSGPTKLLAQMRANPGLRVSNVKRIEIGGRPAIRFRLSVRRALPHSDLCGGRCVPVFTVPFSTFVAFPGELDNFTFLASRGRTIIIAESGGRPEDYAALLRTFRFDP
ncbi:MAG: hypothetical protein M3Q31_05490 [Actinomycetota bacterium]|nr:hypothetical protein [Actinomycetota bacterium]